MLERGKSMSRIIGILNLYDSPSLGDLTKHRTLGSTSFLGRYALMDFALSNFTNSKIDNINVLIKDNFRSVAKHVGTLKTWVNNTKIGRQNLLINEKGIRDKDFNSDLNALRENYWVFYESKADYVIIQPAHILTSMDLRALTKFHEEHHADITIAYTNIKDGKKAFLTSNILGIKNDRVVMMEKNKGKKDNVNVSLRTYVFSREVFDKILFHKDNQTALSLRMLMEKLVTEQKLTICGYEYKGYARCVDSLQHFMEYSFELFNWDVAKHLLQSNWPIYTLTHNTIPAIYGCKAEVTNSIVANGAFIKGKVCNSIVSRLVQIDEKAEINHSILLTGVSIKEGIKVENAIVDKYAKISKDLIGTKENPIYIPQGKEFK